MTQNLKDLKEWIGENETDVDYVTIRSIHRLSATLDRDDPRNHGRAPTPRAVRNPF